MFYTVLKFQTLTFKVHLFNIFGMARDFNTDRNGNPFSEDLIKRVWFFKFSTNPSGEDACGNTIDRDQYGQQTETGWEIDHIEPVAKGGTDGIQNLQPLQWQQNRKKADKFPYHC